jgi:hypothetical protein
MSQRAGLGDAAKVTPLNLGNLSSQSSNSPRGSPRLVHSNPTTPRSARSRAATDADLVTASVFVSPRKHLSTGRFVDFGVIFKERRILLMTRFDADDAKSSPRFMFVFGDNDQQRGKKGQAIIRDCFNSCGIPTKKAPSNSVGSFYTDDEFEANRLKIMRAMRILVTKFILSDYDTMVIPTDGLGTGLEALPTHAPKTYKMLCLAFEALVRQVRLSSKMLETLYYEISGNTNTSATTEQSITRREAAYARDMEVLEGCKTSAIEQIMLKIDKFAQDVRGREMMLTSSSWKMLANDNNSKRGYDSDSMREIDDVASNKGDRTTDEMERDAIALRIAIKHARIPLNE